ncbi:hypothetical protein NDK50_34905 [Paraburkholderia bryophila]|uniref:hypothetical protein n=1 Tax=Paraburkholderia bryophila TaxID=420952 RepID=UPI00234B8C62|nr:hypothetical protein [Paraburkholderia bryophila]WCM23142.1 hypothetical protein NDK50_34905 [Paraburkholderia bryophila]
MNQFIEFDRDTSDQHQGTTSEARDDFEYLYSSQDDKSWSLITMEDTYKAIRQIVHEGRLVPWDIAYRLCKHKMDRELLDTAIKHSAFIYVEGDDFNAFCKGLWTQKYEYRHDRIASGLLRLAFKAGALPVDIFHAYVASEDDSPFDVPQTPANWVWRAYRKFVKTEGSVEYQWDWSGENACFGKAYSLSLVIRQVLSLVIWHDQITVIKTASGFTVRYNEVEHDESRPWDWTLHIGDHDPQTVAAWLEDFIESAYGTGDRLRIEMGGLSPAEENGITQ